MSSVSPRRELECIIAHTEEEKEHSFKLGLTAGYLPKEPKSLDEQDTLDHKAYNLGLRVYNIENEITNVLSHIRMVITMLVVYSGKEIGKDLNKVSGLLRKLRQFKSRYPISEDYLEKRIPPLESQYTTLLNVHREKLRAMPIRF